MTTRVLQADIAISAGDARLAGALRVPDLARGTVIFAHGSGSSRHSPRNRAVASVLNNAGFCTLLFDLLTDKEARDRDNVFDVELLASRLLRALKVLDLTDPDAPGAERPPAGLPVGLFGASTGAAAALLAAAEEPCIRAVVSRGGRPDLAGEALRFVRAPTLLIVGSNDHDVLRLNLAASRKLGCRNTVEIIPGASHLFDEVGTLELVADLACDWFTACLRPDGFP